MRLLPANNPAKNKRFSIPLLLSRQKGDFFLISCKENVYYMHEGVFMKLFLGVCAFFALISPAWGQRPVTQVSVGRPTTTVTVSRPETAVRVVRPATAVRVGRPNTTVTVARPTTAVTVSRPVTPRGVYRPATVIFTSRPSSTTGASASSAASAGGKQGASSSAQAQTSMSDYKPPQAKDFNAPTAASARTWRTPFLASASAGR